jgi:hypothetical protein
MRIAGDDVFDAFDLDRERIVEPDADMARTGEIDEIFDMVGEPLGIGAFRCKTRYTACIRAPDAQIESRGIPVRPRS